MSLESWVSYGWLVRHEASRQEITELLRVVDRDIATAQLPGLPPDWRLNIAYNAALQAATAALAACGYRSEHSAHHYRVLQSLEHTVGIDSSLVAQLEVFRKKRNISSYDRAGAVSELEADRMLHLAENIRELVSQWLKNNEPDLWKL